MTNEEAKSELMQLYGSLSEEKKQALDVVMAQAEKTCDIEKSNFDVRQYKLDTDTAYECGYNAGLQAQADGEYISKSDVLDLIEDMTDQFGVEHRVITEGMISLLPSVAIPSAEPKTGHWIMRHRKVNTINYRTGEDVLTGEIHTVKELIRYECDEPYCAYCGKRAEDISQDYCGYCGARMEGKQNG